MPDDHASADVPPRTRSPESVDPSLGSNDRDMPSTSPTVPRLVRTAGAILILYGFGCLIAVVVLIVMTISRGAIAIKDWVGIIPGIPVALSLIWFGRQSVKGSLPDTRGIGIGSIVGGVVGTGVGLLALTFGLASDSISWWDGTPDPYHEGHMASIAGGATLTLCGLVLILAGTFALMGRADYKTYRQAVKRSAPIHD